MFNLSTSVTVYHAQIGARGALILDFLKRGQRGAVI